MRCPKCETTISRWYLSIATWPFSTNCPNCNQKLRATMSLSKNMLIQLILQVFFWPVAIPMFQYGFLVALLAGFLVAVPISLAAANNMASLKCI
jgi:hypothetical protein